MVSVAREYWNEKISWFFGLDFEYKFIQERISLFI